MCDTKVESQNWKFSENDIVREEHEQFAPGGVRLGKGEYRIKSLLTREKDGKRFYYVEKENGGRHLYSSRAIEHSYEVIPVSESRVWDE